MAPSARCKVVGVIVMLLMSCSATADPAHDARLCGIVLREFAPCIMYLSGRKSEAVDPSLTCCSSIKRLNGQAKSLRYGPRRFCQCIEDFTDVMKIGMDLRRIRDLEPKCNLRLSFPISDGMDCSRVS